MSIMEMAREDVVTVSPEASATDVGQTMAAENVGSVVVVEDSRPDGIITDRDLAMQVVTENADPTELTARDLLVGEVFTVQEDDGLYEVLSKMAEFGVRRAPVVDDGGLVSGIVTLDDFVVLLTSEFENVSQIIQAESPPY